MNQEDYSRAKEKFLKTEVKLTNGVGLNPIKFNNLNNINLKKEFENIEDPYIITCVGELSNRKNQVFLIKAMRHIVKNNNRIVLALVGIGRNKNKYTRLIKKYNLESSIKLLGYRNDVPSIIKESNIIVSSSKQEGLPINIIESLYLGKIVLATNIRGQTNLMKHGHNGYLYKLNDTKGFINEVINISENESCNINIVENAKKTAEKFDVKIISEDLINKYNEIIDYNERFR